MVEPEVAFMDLDGDMRLAEEFLAFVVGRVLETRREELKVLERDTTALERVKAPFPRITYAEAIEHPPGERPPRGEGGRRLRRRRGDGHLVDSSTARSSSTATRWT